MTILSRYLVKELLFPFALSVAALAFLLVTQQALRLVDLLVNRGVDSGTLLRIFAALLPAFFVVTVPIAAMMATIGAFNRLAADREILALRATGCPTRRLVWPAAVFSAVLCAAVYAIALVGEPWSGRSFRGLTGDLLKQQATLAVTEGAFNDGLAGMTLYVERVPEPNRMEGVLIVDERVKGSEWLILADHGAFLNDGESAFSLRLHQGSLHRAPGGHDPDRYQLAKFQSYEVKLDPSRLQSGARVEPDQESLPALRARARAERRDTGSVSAETTHALFTTYKDLAFPLATFWLGVLGVPLGLSTGRTGRLSGFAFGVLAIGAYYVLMIAADAAARGWLPPLAAAALPNAVLAAGVVILLWRLDRAAG
ncbi:MAG: LptF/LptG family permease [Nitrospirota bacterium]